MNNLKIEKFNKSILDNAKLITKGKSFFKTYDLNNGNIIKVVKSVDECMGSSNSFSLYSTYNEFIDELYEKLLKSKDITTPSIVLPNCIYLNRGVPRAYTIPKQIDCVNLNAFLIKNNDLDTITSTILNISKEVKKANKENICMPDLGNSSNILIDPKNKNVRFIDYDGMQIDKYQSFSISSLLYNSTVHVTDERKYFDFKTSLFNSNIDKYALYALYIFYTTKTLLADFPTFDYTVLEGKPILKETAFYDYTKSIGISNTPLEEELHKIFFSNKINYPDTAIKKLVKSHKLDEKFNNTRFIEK